MKHLERIIEEYVQNGLVGNMAVRVGVGGEVLYESFRGSAQAHTLFDMASVTKIMVTTSLALIAIDRGLLSVDGRVSDFYPTEKPLTIRNLLTHTVGIGHKKLNREGFTYENIAQKILAIPSDIEIGSDVRYSCPGFILLGKILEKVFGERLDVCFERMVADPLGLSESSFLPQNRELAVNSNLSEEMLGAVNDYNCRHLGGVAGNAGLFSNILDVTKYVHFLQNKGAPLISDQTFMLAAGMKESRGLGFLYVDERYKQTGGLFADGAIGHCGHTGQSVFVDYRTGLYVIILSDATISTVKKYGKEHYDEVMDMRARLHSAIKCDLFAKS